MNGSIYQNLQERCAEEASTSGADRFGSDLEPLSTDGQLAVERKILHEVDQLLKTVDKVAECFLPVVFAGIDYIVVTGLLNPNSSA